MTMVAMIVIALISLLQVAPADGVKTGTLISNIFELADEMKFIASSGETPYMGFISTGNYDSVSHLFPTSMQPKIFDTVPEVIDCVLTDECIAGLSVNNPLDTNLEVFGVGSVKARGFMFKRLETTGGSAIQNAINTVVNNIAEANSLQLLKYHYYESFGVETVEVRTCAGDDGLFEHAEFDSIRNTDIVIAGLGPYDFGDLGNYLLGPNLEDWTGFFPEYMMLVQAELREMLNITLAWKWYNTSQGVMDAVNNGDADTTDMYWTYAASYSENGTSVSRLSAFDFSCSVLGTDDNVFTKSPLATSDSNDSGLSTAAILGISVAAGVVFFMLVGFITYMVKKEQEGKPLFQQIMQDEDLGYDFPSRRDEVGRSDREGGNNTV